jgi:hypothetical protein
MITGCLVSQAICTAARLGVADRLAAGPRPVEELARECGADADALYRLLRALAAEGVFDEVEPRRFGLTAKGELMRSDVPGTQRPFAIMVGEFMYRALDEFPHSVRTGGAAFDKVFGKPIFEYLAEQPERGRVFDAAMGSIHGGETQPMIEAFDFSGVGTIVDVGGGNASTLLAVLRAAPRARGIVFDLPGVIDRTTRIIDEAGMADRCAVEGGDFFARVPSGGDAYLLRHIIHDWDDDRSVAILSRCREAVAPGGRVLVVESVLPEGNVPHPGKWLDLIMLAIPGGRERTASEYERLFTRAGLTLARIVPTASPVSVIEGVVA